MRTCRSDICAARSPLYSTISFRTLHTVKAAGVECREAVYTHTTTALVKLTPLIQRPQRLKNRLLPFPDLPYYFFICFFFLPSSPVLCHARNRLRTPLFQSPTHPPYRRRACVPRTHPLGDGSPLPKACGRLSPSVLHRETSLHQVWPCRASATKVEVAVTPFRFSTATLRCPPLVVARWLPVSVSQRTRPTTPLPPTHLPPPSSTRRPPLNIGSPTTHFSRPSRRPPPGPSVHLRAFLRTPAVSALVTDFHGRGVDPV